MVYNNYLRVNDEPIITDPEPETIEEAEVEEATVENLEPKAKKSTKKQKG